MDKTILFVLIWFAFIGMINDIIMTFYKRKLAKKCKYNCKECKVLDCLNKECLKYRENK